MRPTLMRAAAAAKSGEGNVLNREQREILNSISFLPSCLELSVLQDSTSAASQLQRHPRQRLALLPEACPGRETPPRATRPEVTTSTNTTQVETQRTLPRTLPALCTASLC